MSSLTESQSPVLDIDAFVDPVFALDREGRFAAVSASVQRLLGCSPSELIGQKLDRYIPETGREGYASWLHSLEFGNAPGALDLELSSADGTRRLVELSARALRSDGVMTGYQGQIREKRSAGEAGDGDLVHRRRFTILREIAESLNSCASIDQFLQGTLRRLISLGPFSTGATFRRRSESKLHRMALVGSASLFPKELLVDESRRSCLPRSYLSYPRLLISDSPMERSSLMEDLAGSGLPLSVILPLVSHGKLQGMILLAGEDRSGLDPDIKSMLRWVGHLMGQTLENLALREKTSELRVRFKDLTESSADHIWEVDRRGRYIYNSPSLTHALGYRPEEVRGHRPIEYVHPEDREEVRSYLVTLQQEKKPLRGMINRVLNARGQIVYIESRAFPVFDAGGAVRGYRGVDRNITDWFESKRALEDTLTGTCEALSRMVELRDPYTKGHSVRVSELMLIIGKEMGRSPYELQGLRLMGLLHDIGKIGIPSEILTKPGRLSPEELELMQQHPARGYEILKDISFPWPVAACVLQHHERLDGSGYPQGLVGDEIIWQVRLLAVSDLLEAMATDRPYRPGLGMDRAIKELVLNRGLLYDPDIVDAVLHLRDKGELAKFFGETEDGDKAESTPESQAVPSSAEDMGQKPGDHPEFILLSLQPDDE